MEEKELAQLELEEAMNGAAITTDDVSSDGGNADLIKNNARLRQAVQLLNDQLELEKIDSLEKIIELESQIEGIPQLKNTIADLDFKMSSC